MDYEKPAIPARWEAFAHAWGERLGLAGKEIRLICATERFGAPIILRLVGRGPKIVFTPRASDAFDAAQRRERFHRATVDRAFEAIEIDMAGFYVEEALVAPAGSPNRDRWQDAVILQLLRVAEPVIDVPGDGEAADAAEDALRRDRIVALRVEPDAPTA